MDCGPVWPSAVMGTIKEQVAFENPLVLMQDGETLALTSFLLPSMGI